MLKYIKMLSLYYQKILFVFTTLIIYGVLLCVFILLPSIFCKTYKISEFYIEDDTKVCIGFRYMYLLYYVLIAILILLTLIASVYIKLLRAGNPYYTLRPMMRIRRSHVLVFIPVYSESKSELENTLDSVVYGDYPIKSQVLFVVVDGHKCGRGNDDLTSNYARELLNVDENISRNGEYELYVGLYKGVKYVLLIKNENGGKKESFIYVIKTLMAFNKGKRNDADAKYDAKYDANYIKEYKNDGSSNRRRRARNFYYELSNSILETGGLNLNKVDYILMLDTDTKVDTCGLRLLVDYLDSNPFTSAVCGETTLTSSTDNILVMAQYYEYYITHYTLKAFETLYGDVLVLSGCFALYRRNILSNKYLIEEYEIDKCTNLYNANISKFGEDRLLTNLILRYYPDFNTKYIERAKCYTNVPLKFKTLLSQRRRWTNSLIFCNLMLLMNLPRYKIWKRISFFLVLVFELWIVLLMPILLTIGYYYSFKSMYDWIIGKGDIAGLVETVLFLCIPIIMCILLGKWRMMGYAFIFMLILPIFSIVIPLYSIYYSDDVSWGNTRKIEEIEMKEIKMKEIEMKEIEMKEIKMENLDTINIDVECKE